MIIIYVIQVVLVSNYTQTLDVCEQLCRSRGSVTLLIVASHCDHVITVIVSDCDHVITKIC